MRTYAHTIQHAMRTGLILVGADEYGELQWLGTKGQFATFYLLESNPELL